MASGDPRPAGYFARQVHQLRTKQGWSQQRFADEGVVPSVGWVRDVEQGRSGGTWFAHLWLEVVEMDLGLAQEAVARAKARTEAKNGVG